jgi:hypothetical protein
MVNAESNGSTSADAGAEFPGKFPTCIYLGVLLEIHQYARGFPVT